MSRNWDGFNDSILQFAPGALATLSDGPYTWLAFIRRTSGNVGLMRWRDGVGTFTRFAFVDSGNFFTEGGATGPAVTNASWRIIGFSMPDVGGGAQNATFLYWDGTTFASSAGGSTAIDGDADQVDIGHAIYRMVGDIAVVAVFAGELSAATLNASDITTELQAWLDLGAIALWPMNQAAAADPVPDATGNGADQIGLVGVNQTIVADPPGFDFSLGVTVTGSIEFDLGALDLDVEGVRTTEGSIQLDLGGLSLTADGERTTFGSVMINLGALELELSAITGGPMADDFYSPGPCRPHEYVSMCTLPIEAVGVTGYALQAASEIVYYATAQRFDTCQVSLRPCRRVCSDWTWGGVINGWSEWGYWGGGPMPALIKGQWYNITCGTCGDTCSCTPLSEVWLPGPVREIVQVVVDGVVLTPDVDYRLDDYRKLVRLGGLDWPWCNDLNKGITEAGTWSVTAFFGLPLPTLGKLAVGELLCEITTDILGGECNLPPGVTDLTRQGVTMTFETVQEALESGFYGLKYVDRFIKVYNPNQLQARPFTYDLDAPTSRVTGTVIT